MFMKHELLIKEIPNITGIPKHLYPGKYLVHKRLEGEDVHNLNRSPSVVETTQSKKTK
jgi:hypothetical protein